MKEKNSAEVMALLPLLSDHGLFCGTDPTELWTKKGYADMLTALSANTSRTRHNYTIDKREIVMGMDGTSAITMEQFIMEAISPTIPIRLVAHVDKDAATCRIAFISYSLIPVNYDVAKINEAVK